MLPSPLQKAAALIGAGNKTMHLVPRRSPCGSSLAASSGRGATIVHGWDGKGWQ